jgi:hypothetical protein
MPDDGIAVLLCDSCGEVFEGYREAGYWVLPGLVERDIVAWADMPEPPAWYQEG